MGDRGEGHLFQPRFRNRHGERQTASGWWWRISIGGRKQTLNTHCTDRRAARKWVLAKLAELQRGDASALTAERVTLDDLERLVRDDYVLRGRVHVRHIPLSFGRLRKHLGNARAKGITTATLTSYAAARIEAGTAPATVNLDFALLGRAFTLAARAGLLPPRPRGWLPALELHNARKGFLERPAFDAILQRVPDALRGLLTVAYITGWRLASDLTTRQWRHVDFAGGWLRLEPGEGKTREGRMFPFTPELRAALEAQRAYTDEVESRGMVVPWVFHRDGRPIRDLAKAWNSARKAAGYPGALIHDFRRTAARNLIRSGSSETVAMALMGLETPTIFKRYCIVDEGMLREATEKLAVLHESQRQEAAKVLRISNSRCPET